MLEIWPIRAAVAGVSVGVVRGSTLLDLDYAEDSIADADANFAFTGSGAIVEVQGTAEKEPSGICQAAGISGKLNHPRCPWP